MKKQLILGLCILSVASCGGFSKQHRSYTLADMFVWGDDYEAQADPQYVKVSYKEIDPSQAKEVEDDKHKSHQIHPYNDYDIMNHIFLMLHKLLLQVLQLLGKLVVLLWVRLFIAKVKTMKK